MIDTWRLWLYPLGLFAQIAFGMRFLVQWIESEKKQAPIAPALFWRFSLFGSAILVFHSYIQAYFPICLFQSLNMVIFWRNLNIKKVSTAYTICLFATVATAITFLFFLQTCLFDVSWISIPWSTAFAHNQEIPLWIHVCGFLGILCYSARFWVQWWQSEHEKKSVLTSTFWILSLSGAVISSIYFYILFDWVNFIGSFLSLLPYSRNLWLEKKRKIATEGGNQ